MYDNALRLLADYHPASNYPEEKPSGSWRSKRALWLTRDSFSTSNQELKQAEDLCKSTDYEYCGTGPQETRGIWRSDKETPIWRDGIISTPSLLLKLITTAPWKQTHR